MTPLFYCILLFYEVDLNACINSLNNTLNELVLKLQSYISRTICDKDMKEFAERCPNLEQLDILGTREVSQVVAQR